MSSGRAIDHIGIAARDLPALAAQYESLGFTLTPLAHHQDHMGTSNRLVQFKGGNFIELLTVDRPQTMLPHSPGFMGFGQFNHDFLAKREGMSLVIFQTQDTAADLARWKARGLDVYDQFNFERFATLPDGCKATVQFELGFVTHPDINVLFYVCHNKAEEHFWKPEYKAHENGAEEIVSIVLSSNNLARDATFISSLFDGEIMPRGCGLSVSCGSHQIDIVPPVKLVKTGWDGAGVDKTCAAGVHLRNGKREHQRIDAARAGNTFIQWTE